VGPATIKALMQAVLSTPWTARVSHAFNTLLGNHAQAIDVSETRVFCAFLQQTQRIS
jgi:hypothetical protein